MTRRHLTGMGSRWKPTITAMTTLSKKAIMPVRESDSGSAINRPAPATAAGISTQGFQWLTTR